MLDELARSPATVQSYRYSLGIAKRITGRPLVELDVDAMRAIKREPTMAPRTKQVVMAACRSFHDWGALEGYWELRPLRAVRGVKVIDRPAAGLSPQQSRILLGACRLPLEFRVVYLGLYAGCRIHESAQMTEANVRGDRLVFVGKGNKERTVPIHVELERVRDKVFGVTPSSAGVLQSSLKRLRRRSGVLDEAGDPVRSHALRRTFALTLYETFNTPREVIAALLGHGDTVTSLYSPVRYATLRATVDRLGYYEDVRRSNRRMVAEILNNGGIKWNHELIVGGG